MPVAYTKSGGQGHVFSVPDYPEAADGPAAFKNFADYLDLILPPVGTLMPFVGSSAPTGWLLCDGAEYDSTAYPKLSTLCGTKFGTAAAGKFKVPNLKGRTIAGYDSSQTEFDTVGKTGGAKSVTLTVSNMPEHDHSVPNHLHTGSVSTITASASGEGAHTHGFSASVSNDGTHGHTSTSLGANYVTDVTVNNLATASGSGANRTNSVTLSKDYATVATSNSGGHSHSFSGTTGAGTSHDHTITVNGGALTLNNSGATTTGKAGTTTPTAVSTIGPYLTLNHIIRAA